MCDATVAFIKRYNVLSAIIEMADFREKRVCTKFCFKLGRTATKCYEKFEDSFWRNKLWVVPKHFSSFPGLRQAEFRLMTIALVDQSLVQRQK